MIVTFREVDGVMRLLYPGGGSRLPSLHALGSDLDVADLARQARSMLGFILTRIRGLLSPNTTHIIHIRKYILPIISHPDNRYQYTNRPITLNMAFEREFLDQSSDVFIYEFLTSQQQARLRQLISVTEQDIRDGVMLIQQYD